MSKLLDKLNDIKKEFDLICDQEDVCCDGCPLDDAAVCITNDECIISIFNKTLQYIKYVELGET